MDPTKAALEILAERFPTAVMVFLAGSVVRGQGTDTSDLDLVIIYEQLEAAYRESLLHGGWPIEAFVHDARTIRTFFARDRTAGVPSLAHMVATGTPLPAPSALSRELRALADETLAAGPPRWSETEIADSRYVVTSLADDLRSPRSAAEVTATATTLYTALAELFLRGQGFWSAKGKSIPRQLETVAPQFARRFTEAFAELFSTGRTEAVIRLCEDALAPFGGWLFAGYKRVAPGDPSGMLDSSNERE